MSKTPNPEPKKPAVPVILPHTKSDGVGGYHLIGTGRYINVLTKEQREQGTINIILHTEPILDTESGH